MRKLSVLILLVISVNSFSQAGNYTIDTVQVMSKILNENRRVIVYKPLNLTKNDSVKFIYLIDGQFSGYRFKRLSERYKDTITNLIGIGIINTDRRRDLLYVYGADKFLDFIASELIPAIEKNYQVKTRILFGHSFGGAFTVFSLLNKPECFDIFIASSPTPIMNLVEKDHYLKADMALRKRIVFFHSFGSKDMGQVRKWSKKLNKNLTGIRFDHLDYRFTLFEGKNHNNSDIPALLNGLKDVK
jgi:predicted alpha/beta superfamily hydrolase